MIKVAADRSKMMREENLAELLATDYSFWKICGAI